MKTVGVGVIGCGIGKWHLEGYDTDPRARVVAISGLEDRCKDIAKEHNVPIVYTDYHDLLANSDIQAVSIAVPNFLHVPIGLDAIAAQACVDREAAGPDRRRG